MKTPKIGLTGTIGSGKTLVSKIFLNLDIPVYYADIEAKKLYNDREVIHNLAGLFSQKVLNTDGSVNTKILADIVFGNPKELQKINNLIHPLLKDRFLNWCNSQSSCYVVCESAIIFEAGWRDIFDKVICIETPYELVCERVQRRDGISEDKVKKRILSQMNQQDKVKMSNFVVYNDDKQLVIPQILNIHSQLSKVSMN